MAFGYTCDISPYALVVRAKHAYFSLARAQQRTDLLRRKRANDSTSPTL